MNCRQALRLLYEVLDKEARERNLSEVKKHLKNCRHCMARYEFEKMFQSLVVNKARDEQDNSQIKTRILSQLDAIDASWEVTTPPAPFRWAAVALAAAAAIIFCVVSSFWIGDFYRYQTEIVPFINAYYAHANSIPDNTYATDPLDYLYNQTGIKITSDQFPVDMIRSVHVDTIKGVSFGCIEVANPHDADRLISIFITPASNYNLPDGPLGHFEGREMFVNTCQRCSMIGEKRGDYIYLIVGEACCKPKQLAKLASAM